MYDGLKAKNLLGGSKKFFFHQIHERHEQTGACLHSLLCSFGVGKKYGQKKVFTPFFVNFEELYKCERERERERVASSVPLLKSFR